MDTENIKSEYLQIRIFSLWGLILEKKIPKVKSGNILERIDLSQFNNKTYFIAIADENGEIINQQKFTRVAPN